MELLITNSSRPPASTLPHPPPTCIHVSASSIFLRSASACRFWREKPCSRSLMALMAKLQWVNQRWVWRRGCKLSTEQ